MPYTIVQKDSLYCVYKEGTDGRPEGASLGCHPTKEQAQEQIAAIYANEKGGYRMTEILNVRYRPAGAVKATTEWTLEVLGVPFGGPEFDNTDLAGERFTPATELWLDDGAKVPVVYYHGYTPEGLVQPYPEIIGWATLGGVDDQGWWFEVALNPEAEYAQRVWEAAQAGTARASSGAISHLVRVSPNTGDILLWPLGELSLFDADPDANRVPMNDWAVAYPAKTLVERFNSVGLALPKALVQAGEATPEARRPDPTEQADNTLPTEETMDEQEVTKIVDDAAVKAATTVLEILEAKEAQAQAEAEKQAEIEAKIRKEVEAEYTPARKGGFYLKKVSSLGLSDDPLKSFLHYVRSGDRGAVDGILEGVEIKAALQEGTDAEGGYLVPEDFYAQIVAKRDEQSIARAMGAFVLPTSRDVVKFPVEDTGQTEFAITAEEGAVSEEEPTFAGVLAQVYRFSKMVKVSVELLADDATNLESFLQRSFARKMALTENKYFLVGTGTGQPKGAVAGSGQGLEAASQTAVTAAEVKSLYYSLTGPYRDGAAWAMKGSTEAAIRALAGEPFYFDNTPGARVGTAIETLMTKPSFNSEYMAAMAQSAKAVLFGNWQFYGIAERQNLAVIRLGELFRANGQIGLLAEFRLGGNVLQADAFKHLVMKTT